MTVDVLLPYYGEVALMQQAVRSVLGQTDPDWRLVVCDDMPQDPAVRQWFDDLRDDRVEYHHNPENLGVNGNFREVLTHVRNPLVQVMGSDDVMLPGYVEWLKAAADAHPEAVIFQPGVVVIDQTGAQVDGLVEKVKRFYTPSTEGPLVLRGEDLAVSILRGDWLYFPSLGWRADTITGIGFREGYEIAEDLALVIDVARSGGALLYDPRLAFMYRRHSASASSANSVNGARFAEERELFEHFAKDMDALGWTRAARVARLHLSSRGHAAANVPGAIASGNWDGLRALATHIFG